MADDNNKTNFSSQEYPKPKEKQKKEEEKEKDLTKKIGDKMKEEAGEEKEKVNTGDETIEKMVQEGGDFIKPKDQEEISAEREEIVNEAGEKVDGFEGDAEEIVSGEPKKEMTEEEKEIEDIINKVENEGKITPEEGEFILGKIREKESEFYEEKNKEEREKLGKEFLKYEELDEEEKKRRESEIEEAKKKFAEDEKVAVENEEEIERKISELEKELKEKFENYAKMDEELRAIYESEDTAGRKELGPVSDQLKEVWKYKLKLEKLRYLRQSLKDKKAGSIEEQIKDPEALLNSCDRRKSGIEHWEKVIAMLDKDFEEMSEEEKSFFEKLLVWVKHNPKKAALIATLIATGVLVAPYAAPYITAENITKAGIVGAGAIGAVALKKLRPQMKRLAEIGGSAAIVGLFLLKDNWGSIDDFAEWACRAKIPNWAKRFEDKSKK